MKRHQDALAIQQGACNPSGIARALVAACDEARSAGVAPSEDPAVKLIVHQMAFIVGVPTCEDGLGYAAWTKACEEAA